MWIRPSAKTIIQFSQNYQAMDLLNSTSLIDESMDVYETTVNGAEEFNFQVMANREICVDNQMIR